MQKRVALDLTQKQFAKRVGVSRKTIQAIELGHLKMSPKLELRIRTLDGASPWDAIKEMTEAYGNKLIRVHGLHGAKIATHYAQPA